MHLLLLLLLLLLSCKLQAGHAMMAAVLPQDGHCTPSTHRPHADLVLVHLFQ
jgi:hypothetical protein